MQIGGHARSEGVILVTNNLGELSRMPGVRVGNWLEMVFPVDTTHENV